MELMVICGLLLLPLAGSMVVLAIFTKLDAAAPVEAAAAVALGELESLAIIHSHFHSFD